MKGKRSCNPGRDASTVSSTEMGSGHQNPSDLRMPFHITTWCEGGCGRQQQCHRLLGRCAWPIRAPVFQLDLADAAF